jgi:hypothetical protein
VEVEEGLEIGSKVGSDCLPSCVICSVLNDGRSRTCSLEEGRRVSIMGEALYGGSVEAVIAVGKECYIAFEQEREGN